jgi:hypothetical protein
LAVGVRLALFIFAFALAAAVATSAASYVNIIAPYNYTLNGNSSIYLGKVGPGQTFYVTISSTTANRTGTTLNYGWNELLAANVPKGWIVANSSLYNTQLSVEVTAAPDAANGTYALNLTAVNVGNYSKIGALRFQAFINVTPDVFNLNVTPQQLSTGPGEPINVYVTINNTGVSDNPFIIKAEGLPAWNATKSVIALHHTSATFVYPVYENEPGVYKLAVNVSSSSSPLIDKRTNASLAVQASVTNDYAAIGQGSLAFQVLYAPVYSIMYLISLVFKH